MAYRTSQYLGIFRRKIQMDDKHLPKYRAFSLRLLIVVFIAQFFLLGFYSLDNDIEDCQLLCDRHQDRAAINLSDCYFMMAFFGKRHLQNDGKFRRYFHALSTIIPGANTIFCVSEFTEVDSSLYQYNLNLKIVKYGKETPESLQQRYGNIHFSYYVGLRYQFYAEYLESHPEIKYAIFTDHDALVLHNPFILLEKDPEEVHFMFDVRRISYRDNNYNWLRSWMYLNDSISSKCGITKINKTMDDPLVLNHIPLNGGLFMGKSHNLILYSRLMASRFFCPGIFDYNAEQGLLNLFYLSGQLFTLGVKFHGHYVHNGSIVSCPNLLRIRAFRKRMRTNEIFILHHYHLLSYFYVRGFEPLYSFRYY